MMACVIMHNMIIENERGQGLDDHHYKLMACLVRPCRQHDRIAVTLSATTRSLMNIPMKIFRRMSWRSGGHGGGNRGMFAVVELCDELCVFVDELCLFMMNYAYL
jgi:hypothetical protein